MIRYVVLNGPIGVGKTEIAREACSYLRSRAITCVTESFFAPIKHFIAAAISDKYQHIDRRRARPELNGYSVDNFSYDLLEAYLKKRYGEDVLGKWLVYRTLKDPTKKQQVVVIDDGNFQPEVDAVPNKYIVRITKVGRIFEGQYRSYRPEPDYVIHNDGDTATTWNYARELGKKIEELVR